MHKADRDRVVNNPKSRLLPALLWSGDFRGSQVAKYKQTHYKN